MKLFADENIDAAVVMWLRSTGHDVRYAAEDVQATPDPLVLRIATEDGRVFLTSDRDFGEIVYRQRQAAVGIILLRLHAETQEERLLMLQPHWPEIERRAIGNFIAVTRNRLRIRPLIT